MIAFLICIDLLPARWWHLGCRYRVGIASVLGLCASAVQAGEIRVAVAANFLTTAEAIADEFEKDHGHQVVLASGSTGGLYAQIRHGAAYDLLLAADQKRPALLEETGNAVQGSQFTYALGRLSLWSVTNTFEDGQTVLQDRGIRHLAIANPDLAPYGIAARETLKYFDRWPFQTGTLVLGQNVGQTAAMVASGNAELGLVATSFLVTQSHGGSRWDIPAEAYNPIRQDVVLLNQGNPAATEFLTYLGSAAARSIIRAHGYEVPE